MKKTITTNVCMALLMLFAFVAKSQVIFPLGSTWKYLDNGTDQGSAWKETAFDDNAWQSGVGEFGYSIGSVATTVSFGSDQNNKYVATYFRKNFNIADVNSLEHVKMVLKRDDGAVIYINGVEVLRSNMPVGTITYTTFSSSNNQATETHIIPKTAFVQGNNVIAVSVHQTNLTSSDLWFDISLQNYSNQFPLSLGNIWKYLDNGSDQGTVWQDASYDDAAWNNGFAPLGYVMTGVAKTISFGPSSSNKYRTSYFRRKFDVTTTDLTNMDSVLVTLNYDDGAVIYLNNQEIGRANMPTGSITFTTLANSPAVSHPNTCGGSYTWYLPSTEKRTTAKWWSSINRSSTIFTGYNILSGKTTVFPMVCVKIPFIGCQCSGPYTIGGTVLLSTETKSKPASAINYDDVPGSSLSAHLEYYNTSAYPFYNNSLAGSAFAKNDPSLHAFAPTMSSLDIRNPTTGQPVSDFSRLDNEQGGLNLLNKSYDIKTNKLIQHAEKRYGFPHLSYPTNHYKVTPYDAVYAIGTDNGTYSDGITPKPNNQLHVEDPQTMMGEYLANVEVAPINLFLSNLTVGASASTFAGYNGGYTAEFEARDKIIVGKTDNIGNNIYSLYNNLNYLTPNGDFKVAIKSKAILHSGDFVEFLPGTEIPIGAELEAYILPYSCKNLLAKINKNQNNNNADDEPTATYNLPDKGFDYEKPINKTDKPITSFLLYPNPNNGSFVYVNVCEEQTSLLTIYNISGIVVYSQQIYNNTPSDLNLDFLDNGLYIVKVMNKNSTDNFKLTISK